LKECLQLQPETDPFGALEDRWRDQAWVHSVCRQAQKKLATHPHGDLSRWQIALQKLPGVPRQALLDSGVPTLGAEAQDPQLLRKILMELHPWRKGPLCLGGLEIETEWRSDWKWARVKPHIELTGHRVLDIGCGNGYFGLRMLGAGAALVIGIDPMLLYVMQWLACRHFSGDIANYVLPLGIEDLPEDPVAFDTVLSMGVLYHRKDPAHHLKRIHSLLRPGGTMVLETLVLPRERPLDLLVPEARYARMRNVWAIPGIDRLVRWVRDAGFNDFDLVDTTKTTIMEQRSTVWLQFESLAESLDPVDQNKTIEGHPAPLRALLIASC
jgi:tRNA (mo5U34)-methyltransferase